MSDTTNRTYVNRHRSYTQAMQARYRVARARKQLQDAFPDDGRREIPAVAAAFTSVDQAMRDLLAVAKLFEGSGPYQVQDFLPSDDNTEAGGTSTT